MPTNPFTPEITHCCILWTASALPESTIEQYRFRFRFIWVLDLGSSSTQGQEITCTKHPGFLKVIWVSFHIWCLASHILLVYLADVMHNNGLWDVVCSKDDGVVWLTIKTFRKCLKINHKDTSIIYTLKNTNKSAFFYIEG